MESLSKILTQTIKDVPDFPQPGIMFKDITPIWRDPALVRACASALAAPFQDKGINKVVGIESRGFLLGPMIAQALDCAFVLIRKKGKLPGDAFAVDYQLEYGSATIEVLREALAENDNILIHDDLLATGGTAAAAAHLCKEFNAQVKGFGFIVNLKFLGGEKKLHQFSENITNLVEFN